MKRVLVLGGGGIIGIAWETGLVSGLSEGGIDVRDADLVVGTSAGSVVGTRLAAGQDVSQARRTWETECVRGAERCPALSPEAS